MLTVHVLSHTRGWARAGTEQCNQGAARAAYESAASQSPDRPAMPGPEASCPRTASHAQELMHCGRVWVTLSPLPEPWGTDVSQAKFVTVTRPTSLTGSRHQWTLCPLLAPRSDHTATGVRPWGPWVVDPEQHRHELCRRTSRSIARTPKRRQVTPLQWPLQHTGQRITQTGETGSRCAPGSTAGPCSQRNQCRWLDREAARSSAPRSEDLRSRHAKLHRRGIKVHGHHAV